MQDDSLWRGLRPEARKKLDIRNYSAPAVEQRIATEGLEAGAAVTNARVLKEAGAWIPGVELIFRHVHPQRHRGLFSELGREGQGRLGEIGLWPKQWAAAKMFAGSSKGFHIHPPHIPEGTTASEWYAKLFLADEPDYSLRRYDLEQWDVMYFLQGRLDLTLCDERDSMPRRVMRLFIDGDDRKGTNNIAVVIPPESPMPSAPRAAKISSWSMARARPSSPPQKAASPARSRNSPTRRTGPRTSAKADRVYSLSRRIFPAESYSIRFA